MLRARLGGGGLRTVAERAGVERKTARRYVEAAQQAGLVREGGEGQSSDELIGMVVQAVRPTRPGGHGATWEMLEARHVQIRSWVKNDRLSVVKSNRSSPGSGSWCRIGPCTGTAPSAATSAGALRRSGSPTASRARSAGSTSPGWA